MNRDWMTHANCRGIDDPDLFFPDQTGVAGARQAAEAQRICEGCPVLVECAQYRQATSSDGVWAGGMHRNKSLLQGPKRRRPPTMESNKCIKCGELWSFTSGPHNNFQVITRWCPSCVEALPTQGWGLVR